ncbi:AI-2E family transporter [Amaricoccus solimangrovi]|uniref:AI-2E family transporter n=1 Tax=Amaricoccus solimangrovi TaxID=2589815 RepID=A0A501W8Q1_9RHOB|nr:AI-2E family transporter [Amaricoccus solimangrovi]TPE45112.1 AI-2E family transporter [Amaricoccus solimangrovi]
METEAERHLRSIAVTFRAGVIAALLLPAVWLLRDVLLLVFASILAACALRAAATSIHRRTGLGTGVSLALVGAVLLVMTAALLWWRGPALAEQAIETGRHVTSQIERITGGLEESAWGRFLLGQLRHAASAIRGLTGSVPGFAVSVLGIGGSLLVGLVTAFSLAAAPGTYVSGALRLLPPCWRPRGREVLSEIGETLRGWVAGQLFDMAVVAVLIGSGLAFLGIPLAFTLSLIAGLLNFVPYVGALAGAVPAVAVALAQAPTDALWVCLLFLSVQMLEGNVIAPLIQKRAASLPPTLTILSQTVLGTVFGAFGIVVATPLLAAVVVATRMIYVEGVLERKS